MMNNPVYLNSHTTAKNEVGKCVQLLEMIIYAIYISNNVLIYYEDKSPNINSVNNDNFPSQ